MSNGRTSLVVSTLSAMVPQYAPNHQRCRCPIHSRSIVRGYPTDQSRLTLEPSRSPRLTWQRARIIHNYVNWGSCSLLLRTSAGALCSLLECCTCTTVLITRGTLITINRRIISQHGLVSSRDSISSSGGVPIAAHTP